MRQRHHGSWPEPHVTTPIVVIPIHGPALACAWGLHRETEDAMLDPITLLALRNKILTMEADRHGLGWTILPASMHVIGVDGRSLRHQALPRPHRLIPTDPPHIQVAAYATAAGPIDPFSAVGVPVAACVIAELCPGCLSSRPPRRIRRLWHARWHQPAVRALIAVDVAEARYYLQRDRDIVPPHQYATQAGHDGGTPGLPHQAIGGPLGPR